jgi:hypothetical protein
MVCNMTKWKTFLLLTILMPIIFAIPAFSAFLPQTQIIDQANHMANVTTGHALQTDSSATTQPISAASLPLPLGASTSALQSAIIATLGSPFQAGGSIGNTAFGISGTLPPYAATPTFNVGTTGGIALDSTLSSFSAKFGSLGQKTSAGSAPVVIASDQSPIAVTGTITTSPNVNVHDASGTGITSTLNSGKQSLDVNISNSAVPISAAALPLPSNAAQETGGHLASIDTKLTSPLTTNATLQAGTANIGHIDGQGTAGTPVGGVVSVQGVSGGQALPISGTVTSNIGTTGGLALDTTVSGLQVSQGSTTSGQKGGLSLGAVTTASPAYTTGQTDPLSLTLAGALRTDSSAITQPISGTVTANAGTNLNTSALALSSNQTNGTQQTEINNGANVAAVKAASTAAVATDPALVVAVSPNNTPVLPSGAATGTNQTNGTQKTQIVDGSNATVGPVQTISGTNYEPVVLAASATNGSAVVARSIQIAGSDGTNARNISTDTSGNVNTNVKSILNNTDTTGSGNITAGGQQVLINSNGAAACAVNLSGTWSANLIVEGYTNTSNPAVINSFAASGGAQSVLITANGTYIVPVGGFNQIEVTTFTFTSGTAVVNWDCGLGINTSYVGLAPASASSSSTVGSVSLGQSTGKVNVMKTGNINTTATTANQIVLTYTVTAAKTFYIEYYDCTASTAAAAVTATAFGTCSLSINGTIVHTQYHHGSGYSTVADMHDFTEPIPVAAGQVVLIEVTPSAATSFFWYANFGGYEK